MDSASDNVALAVQDEWDAEGFEIPSLNNGKSEKERKAANKANKDSLRTTSEKAKKGTEKIYLGPHGAPPSHAKHADSNAVWKKQHLKQKPKGEEMRDKKTRESK